MPILYTVKAFENVVDGKKEKKYYLIAKRWEQIGYEVLLEEMVRNTTLHAAEARSAMDFLFESIPRLLETGNSVSLGPLGYLRTTIKSEGSDTPEEATHHKVKDISVHFIPSRELRERVRRMPLSRFPEMGESIKAVNYNNAMLMAKREAERRAGEESARRCLAEGLSVEQAARISGLSAEEIARLATGTKS